LKGCENESFYHTQYVHMYVWVDAMIDTRKNGHDYPSLEFL